MFLLLVDQIAAVLHMVESIAQKASINMIYVETILKIVGIAYIAEFGSQVTKDAGQGSIASKIELAGKVMIIALAIPIITVVIETILSFLPG